MKLTEDNGYQHLNKDKEMGISIPQVANQLAVLNYGHRRMLEAILFEREKSERTKYEHFREANQQLRKLLEEGWY